MADILGPASITRQDSPRSGSPSPDVSPTAALPAYAPMERSVSMGSSVSSDKSGTTAGRRRGFARPQGTAFADSARNRDSVMSLGTIAHLQHYFARTGLLDGKGAQVASQEELNQLKLGRSESAEFAANQANKFRVPSEPSLSEPSLSNGSSVNASDSSYQDDNSFISSPEQSILADGSWEEPYPLTLPPTVSTYKQKTVYVPPPPNLAVLRRELREALDDAKKMLNELEQEENEKTVERDAMSTPERIKAATSSTQGWHEIQGLQVLDLVTLAIRAAKNYYTSHEKPQRLYAIKAERQIRSELYGVLEILKKLAARNFAGGVRKIEREQMMLWALGIGDLVTKEEEAETQEHDQRQKWVWMDNNDCSASTRERDWLFLKSFDPDPTSLPRWEISAADGSIPSAFLSALQSGLRLVQLHNGVVKSSRRKFEEIKVFHMDTAKPYRCADNLRYWIKAAELRWDVLLDVDVQGVVHGHSTAAWIGFEAALSKWCKAVREQVVQEWHEHREALKLERPTFRMEATDMTSVPW